MSTTRELLKDLQPEAVGELERLEAVAAESADPELLELCVDRVAAMLSGAGSDRDESATPRERAYLDFTEQFVTSVSTVSDQQVEALLEHASSPEVYAFIEALYVREMALRVELVAAEVLS